MGRLLIYAIAIAGLAACGDEGDEKANSCPAPFEPYCCSEAGIPLDPDCIDGELVCPEGTLDCGIEE